MPCKPLPMGTEGDTKAQIFVFLFSQCIYTKYTIIIPSWRKQLINDYSRKNRSGSVSCPDSSLYTLVIVTELPPEILNYLLCNQERIHSCIHFQDVHYCFSNSNVHGILLKGLLKIGFPEPTTELQNQNLSR